MRLSSSHLYIEPMSRAGIASAQQSLPEELQALCAACSDTLTAAEGDRLWRTGWLVYTSGKKPEIVGLLRLSGPPDTTHTVELSGRFRADTPSSHVAEAVRCFLKKWLWKQAAAVYVQTSPELLACRKNFWAAWALRGRRAGTAGSANVPQATSPWSSRCWAAWPAYTSARISAYPYWRHFWELLWDMRQVFPLKNRTAQST